MTHGGSGRAGTETRLPDSAWAFSPVTLGVWTWTWDLLLPQAGKGHQVHPWLLTTSKLAQARMKQFLEASMAVEAPELGVISGNPLVGPFPQPCRGNRCSAGWLASDTCALMRRPQTPLKPGPQAG
ncbi:unnamed protein product [Pipistrellus nathusii]|uniref:Uncharacterized protein n=1 Tax=Pipistrellus nathusii TaxID=59473 RepID=A0ABP0AFA0_PIPNA